MPPRKPEPAWIAGSIMIDARHPPYLALAGFGLGIILTWGRLRTLIA